MPTIDRFDGGLVTGVDSVYLNNTQATILLDANIEKVGLSSANKPKVIGNAARSFYEFPILDSEPEEFHITSSDVRRSYAEFQGALCYSDGGPVCQIATGVMAADGLDFVWNTLGIEAAEGTIVAYALELEHIVGASTIMHVHQSPGTGHITASNIRYRIVDTADNNTVYIHAISNNTGYASVDWVLPRAGLEVYREILDNFGNYTDKFLLVYTTEAGDLTFTDGLFPLSDEYSFLEPTEAPQDVSGHRQSLLAGQGFSSPYTISISDTEAIITISKLAILDLATETWNNKDINISIKDDNFEDVVGIASTFVYMSTIYVMSRLNSQFRIHTDAGVEVFNSDKAIDEEFFKGSTVEWQNKLYFFNPRDGQVGIFDGATFLIEDSIPKFPYALAEDSVFTIKEGTNEVYAVINDRHEANIRKILLPDMEMHFVGTERIGIPYIRGLGGTSGANFTSEDFQVMPIHGGMIKFSTITHQVIEDVSENVLEIPTWALKKMYAYDQSLGAYSTYSAEDYYEAWFSGVKPNVNVDTHDVPIDVKWFDEETLSGTYLYNVAQKTPDGSSEGPIMDVDSEPVSVYKGHIRVDVTGITHAEPLRLYRTGGYLTRYTMVEDIEVVDFYVDNRSDVTIALGRNGNIDYVYAPPEGTKYLTEHRGMLFGAVGNTVYWSEPGQANAWDELNSFVIVDREVTALASSGNGLLIFMKGRIKLLMGTSRADFALRTVTNEKGTVDHFSVQALMNGAVFFSDDGMCFTDGSQVKELSYDILGPQVFDVIDSAATNRSYYAIIKAYTSDLLHKARIMIRYDFGKTPVYSLLSADTIDGLGTIHSRISHSAQGILYDTLGADKRTLNYRSGNITEGMPTMIKEWDRVRVTGDFQGTLFVYIDDVKVVTQPVDLKGCNIHIPKEKNKGKAIAFELVGVGFVASIEYSITARKTSK